MKKYLTLIISIISIACILGPWIFLAQPSKWWFLLTLWGLVLGWIIKYGIEMEMLGMGNTGEKFLIGIYVSVKKKFKLIL